MKQACIRVHAWYRRMVKLKHNSRSRGGVWGWQVGRPPQAPLLRGPRASGFRRRRSEYAWN